MKKSGLIFGLIILIQIMVISGIGLAMYLYSIASHPLTPTNGPAFSPSELEEGTPAIFWPQDRFDESGPVRYHIRPEWTEQPVKSIQATESIQTTSPQADYSVDHACSSSMEKSSMEYTF